MAHLYFCERPLRIFECYRNKCNDDEVIISQLQKDHATNLEIIKETLEPINSTSGKGSLKTNAINEPMLTQRRTGFSIVNNHTPIINDNTKEKLGRIKSIIIRKVNQSSSSIESNLKHKIIFNYD